MLEPPPCYSGLGLCALSTSATATMATHVPQDLELDAPPKYEAHGQLPIFSEKTIPDGGATKKKLMALLDREKKLVMDIVQQEGDNAWRRWKDREGLHIDEWYLLSFCRLERSRSRNVRLFWDLLRFETRTRVLETRALEKRCKKEFKAWRLRQQEMVAGDYATKKTLIQTGQVTEEDPIVTWSRKVRADMDAMLTPLRDLELWFDVMPFRGECPVPRGSRLMGLARAVSNLPFVVPLVLLLLFDAFCGSGVPTEEILGDKELFVAVGRWKDEAEAVGRRGNEQGRGIKTV